MNKDRFLRSKRLRTALWIKANGRRESCGRELPKDWHADHSTPWAVTNRTNVHEMQALWPECNVRKGSTMPPDTFELRGHQRRFWSICRKIAEGSGMKLILVPATPGSGKSALPVVGAKDVLV
jgi:hypothetical protein